MRKFIAFLALIMFPLMVFAQTQAEVDAGWFADVSKAISGFGGMFWMLKIGTIILLIIGSMKVSFLKPLWEKLGPNLQPWLAPTLGFVAGLLMLAVGNAPPTIASIIAYITAGSGALVMHEWLESLKALPGLGPIYVSVINIIESILGANKA